MARIVWLVSLEDGPHRVELQHGYFTGRRTLCVDGMTLTQWPSHLVDWGSTHHFAICGHECAVLIRAHFLWFHYDFVVDGRSVTTGRTVEVLPTVRRISAVWLALWRMGRRL